jgi:hypothetical protein
MGDDMGKRSIAKSEPNPRSGPKIVFLDQLELRGGEQVNLSSRDAANRLAEVFDQLDDQTEAIRAGVTKLTTALAEGFQRTAEQVRQNLSTVEIEVSFELKGEGNVLLLKASGGAAIKVKLEWKLK